MVSDSEAGAGGEGTHRDGIAGVVLHRERDGGLLAGGAVGHLDQREIQAGDALRLIGDGVRAHDGGVEIELTLRDVALGALGVVGLRQVDVVQRRWRN